jgi:hypothetical protein
MPSKLPRLRTAILAGLAALSLGGVAAATTGLPTASAERAAQAASGSSASHGASARGDAAILVHGSDAAAANSSAGEASDRGRPARAVPGLGRRAGRRPRPASGRSGVPGPRGRRRRRRPGRGLLCGRDRDLGRPWAAAGRASRWQRRAWQRLAPHHRAARRPGQRQRPGPGRPADHYLIALFR